MLLQPLKSDIASSLSDEEFLTSKVTFKLNPFKCFLIFFSPLRSQPAVYLKCKLNEAVKVTELKKY